MRQHGEPRICVILHSYRQFTIRMKIKFAITFLFYLIKKMTSFFLKYYLDFNSDVNDDGDLVRDSILLLCNKMIQSTVNCKAK
jgi:hypothetical protein